jgi:hypothetical protein
MVRLGPAICRGALLHPDLDYIRRRRDVPIWLVEINAAATFLILGMPPR